MTWCVGISAPSQLTRLRVARAGPPVARRARGDLAERYSCEVIGVVIPGGSTLAAPSAGELSSLAEEVARKGLPAVFAEMTESTRLIETLTAEAGSDVDVVSLYTGSLGEAGSGTDTYIGMIETDARRIADALH